MKIERETMVRERNPRLEEIQANMIFYAGKAAQKMAKQQARIGLVLSNGRTKKPYSKYTDGTIDDVFLLEEEKISITEVSDKYADAENLNRAIRRASRWAKKYRSSNRRDMPRHIAEKITLLSL